MGQTDGRPGSGAQEGGAAAGGGSGRRRQHAGFSVFLDQVVDEAGTTHWETRLYHAESGEESTLRGAAPDAWVGWILDRIGIAGGRRATTDPVPSRAVVEIASVEILDVTVEPEDASGDQPTHAIRAQLVVELTGIASLEREIGSRVLRGMTGRKPTA